MTSGTKTAHQLARKPNNISASGTTITGGIHIGHTAAEARRRLKALMRHQDKASFYFVMCEDPHRDIYATFSVNKTRRITTINFQQERP